MSNQQTIINVRGRKTLDGIKMTSKGRTLVPSIFKQQHKNPRADGDFEEEYTGRPFMGARKYIPPIWDTIKNRWYFDGSVDELQRLISQMNLRYPKDHPKRGQIIEPGNTEARLSDRYDAVFTHKEFFTGYYLSDGRTSLDPTDAKQKFLYLCYRANKDVWDKASEDKRPNKRRLQTSTLEMSTIGTQNVKDKDRIDTEVKASLYLSKMSNDVDKMQILCEIMRVPGFNRKSTDPNGLYILLYNKCVMNTEFNSRFGTTWQNEYIRLCELDTEELDFIHKVRMGMIKGAIRQKTGYFSFKGERLEVKTEKDLIEYFRNPANHEKFSELLEALELN